MIALREGPPNHYFLIPAQHKDQCSLFLAWHGFQVLCPSGPLLLHQWFLSPSSNVTASSRHNIPQETRPLSCSPYLLHHHGLLSLPSPDGPFVEKDFASQNYYVKSIYRCLEVWVPQLGPCSSRIPLHCVSSLPPTPRLGSHFSCVPPLRLL